MGRGFLSAVFAEARHCHCAIHPGGACSAGRVHSLHHAPGALELFAPASAAATVTK